MKTLTTKLLALVILPAFLLIGCSDDNPVPDPAPDFPYKSSMVMEFDDFTTADTTGGKDALSHQHWSRAASHVLVWNTVLTITLAVPVKSFQEALKHEAVYDPDTETWTWSYNFWAVGALHLAELKAKLVTEGVEWKMYITKNNEYSDFLWYTGISNPTNTSGHWELKSHPNDPTDFLHIEWNRYPEIGSGDIKYTNIIPGDTNNGSYIFYGTDPTPVDAYYTIYGVPNDVQVDIEWIRESLEGRIRDELFFNDNEWHCWDNMLKDTDCE